MRRRIEKNEYKSAIIHVQTLHGVAPVRHLRRWANVSSDAQSVGEAVEVPLWKEERPNLTGGGAGAKYSYALSYFAFSRSSFFLFALNFNCAYHHVAALRACCRVLGVRGDGQCAERGVAQCCTSRRSDACHWPRDWR